VEDCVRRVSIGVVGVIGLLQASAASAQTELALKQAFEGQFVVVRMDMPATHKGVDLYPDREPSVDFAAYSARLREFGVALREGDRVMVTSVRVKKKNIEVHLGGGGYGVFGDDSGYVYVPTESKSQREKDLEKWIRDERDSDRRRRMQRELDDLRRDRERENRRRESEKRDLEARKQGEIADKRLSAGSRFNLWFDEYRLAQGAPTPIELRRMLAQFLDVGGREPRGPLTAARQPAPPPRDEPPAVRLSELRRGLSADEVHDLLGTPARSKPGKQGDLATLSEWYEHDDRVTEVVYVAGVVVRFSTASK
jgi:hypothetical protein